MAISVSAQSKSFATFKFVVGDAQRLPAGKTIWLKASINGKIYKGDKEKGEIEKTNIAPATIVTPLLVNKDFKVIIASDEFKRVTEESFSATINYDKGKSNVKSSETKQDDIKNQHSFFVLVSLP